MSAKPLAEATEDRIDTSSIHAPHAAFARRVYRMFNWLSVYRAKNAKWALKRTSEFLTERGLGEPPFGTPKASLFLTDEKPIYPTKTIIAWEHRRANRIGY